MTITGCWRQSKYIATLSCTCFCSCWVKHDPMTDTPRFPTGSTGANTSVGARPDNVSVDGEILWHPRGNCAGRRNAAAFGTGRPNGASRRSFSLSSWVPVYKLVATNPKRPTAARNHFAALYRALLSAKVLSVNAHALLSLLLDESSNDAKSVHRQVWWLADALDWGDTKVKAARRECEDLGLLVHHNRRHETDQGVRMRANRYGFTWNVEVISRVGFDENTMIKHCGVPEVVYLEKVRREMRGERRQAAVLSGKAQAERGKALLLVDELIEQSDGFRQADRWVRERFAGNPELENFALDHLETEWPKHQAGLDGRKIAMLDLSRYDQEMQLHKLYGDRPELLDLAMAHITIRRPE